MAAACLACDGGSEDTTGAATALEKAEITNTAIVMDTTKPHRATILPDKFRFIPTSTHVIANIQGILNTVSVAAFLTEPEMFPVPEREQSIRIAAAPQTRSFI